MNSYVLSAVNMTKLSTHWKDRGKRGIYRRPAMLLLALLVFGASPVAAFDMFSVCTYVSYLLCIVLSLTEPPL